MTEIKYTVVYEGENGVEKMNKVSWVGEDGGYTKVRHHPDASEWEDDVSMYGEEMVRIPTDRIIRIEEK